MNDGTDTKSKKMKDTATLISVNHASGVCVFSLSRDAGLDTFFYGKKQLEFTAYVRSGYTKIALNGVEVSKSLGVKLYRDILSSTGYRMVVDPVVLATFTDDELLRLAEDFNITGDDASAVDTELRRR